ncbi:MAG TPA: hypothetical protein VF857_07350 [Spirochaetota bacterium]
MNTSIHKLFHQVLINTLSTPQVNYLGELFDKTFNLHKAAGLNPTIPIPRQNAADVLMKAFPDENDIVRLFALMLAREGTHFYNRELAIWGRDEFIRLLERNKWIFDSDLNRFFVDPFYEHELNFLHDVRVIDLRERTRMAELVRKFESISKKMSIKDIDWRITLRLYDLDPKTGELIRKVINLLLIRQNLQSFTHEVFFCLKELVINASKANYKILFQKYMAKKKGVDPDADYDAYLEAFKSEIEEFGNKNLLKLAKAHDRFITIVFQSSVDAIEMWVVNNQEVSAIEKRQILKIVAPEKVEDDSYVNEADTYAEGAGLGLTLILNILARYCQEPEPLKVIFYPNYIKIGFTIARAELTRKLEEKKEIEGKVE